MNGINQVIGRIGEIVQRIAPPVPSSDVDFASILDDAQASGTPRSEGDASSADAAPSFPVATWLSAAERYRDFSRRHGPLQCRGTYSQSLPGRGSDHFT